MASIATGTASAAPKSKLISQWMIVTVTIAIAYFAVTKLVDAGRKVIAQKPAATVEAVFAHCTQFILLAQAKYADDWKVRLDPRDTVCADQIQVEWERQAAERRETAELERRPTYVETDQAGQMAQDVPPDADASRVRNPETYCLNMISLARTKLGPEWKSRLTPEQLAGCESAVSAASN